MKKVYEKPLLEVVILEEKDILTESSNTDLDWPWGEDA